MARTDWESSAGLMWRPRAELATALMTITRREKRARLSVRSRSRLCGSDPAHIGRHRHADGMEWSKANRAEPTSHCSDMVTEPVMRRRETDRVGSPGLIIRSLRS